MQFITKKRPFSKGNQNLGLTWIIYFYAKAVL